MDTNTNPIDINPHNYAGFWIRVLASLIDTCLLLMVIWPILFLIYGEYYWTGSEFIAGTWDVILSYLFPAIAVIAFWICKSSTPGKMLFKLIIVDAQTNDKPSTGQFIGRYLGYYLAMIPLLLGIIWVGIDKRKQGWHDKLAGTVVIRKPPTSFDSP